MAGTHSNQTKNHRPHTWEFTNSAARIAFTGYPVPTVDDVGKWAQQLDDGSYWTLTDDSPITWATVTGGVSADELATHAAIDAAQTVKGHTSWEMIQDMLAVFLVAGTNITLTYDDTTNTVTVASTAGLTTEQIQDVIGALISGGTGVTATYDDTANTLVIDIAAHANTDATQTVKGHVSFEMIQDMLASALVGGTGITITYDDTANTITLAATGLANPMTTAGDIILGGSSGTPTRMGIGTDTYVLTIDSTTHLPVWAAATGGGGSSPITTDGDIIYGDSGGIDTRLPIGSDGQVLGVASGLPTWVTVGSGGGSPYPLNAATLDATYGDEFDAASLNARWTRYNISSGDEIYQQENGSWMRAGLHNGPTNKWYWQAAPSGDFAIVLVFKALEGTNAVVGPAFIDTSGNGVMMSLNSDGSVYVWALAAYAWSSAIGGNSFGYGIAKGLAIPMWMKLAKVGTGYQAFISLNGIAWINVMAPLTSVFTVDRIGFGRCFSNNVAYIDVDRFNVE